MVLYPAQRQVVSPVVLPRTANGRLKLCEFSAEQGELIFCRRANQRGLKQSNYLLSPPSAPGLTKRIIVSGIWPSRQGREAPKRSFSPGASEFISIGWRIWGDFLGPEVVLGDGNQPRREPARQRPCWNNLVSSRPPLSKTPATCWLKDVAKRFQAAVWYSMHLERGPGRFKK